MPRLAPPLPREHGTWAWLIVPLAVGAGAAGRANVPVALLGTSALLAFLARMPVELALRRSVNRRVNIGWAVLLGAVAAVAAVVLLAGYGRWWLLPLAVPLVAGPLAVAAWRNLRRRWRAVGVLLVIACLSALAPAAHYASEGTLEATGLTLWLLASLYGGSSLFYVRMLLAKGGNSAARRGRRRIAVSYHAALVALVAVVVLAGEAPPLAPVAFVPLLAKLAYRLAAPPDHLDLPKTGLFEAMVAALFAVLVVAAYRLG